ncbi:dihydrofolate reductase family protein [bacterium]|nr:dihydrofolate reductase family protein [bacterium]
MRALRYTINITLDGCCDHRVGIADADLHQYAAGIIAESDALIYGRVVYQMMEEAWRPVAETGLQADWMEDWMVPFARTIHQARKYVVSDSLPQVDWNAQLVRGHELEATVWQLKQQPGRRLSTGGVRLPLALAELDLIDEYEFIVHPRVAGHGPTLLAGLSQLVDLKLEDRRELRSGAAILLYTPKR